MSAKKTFPTVKLTQQDFVSTFPWGVRGDRVRIMQQEVENKLLDAETTAAMAVMLGADSYSDRLDEAWKTLLNSQNHDVHVCMQDEAGIAWCEEAGPMADSIKADAGKYIAEKLGGDVEINALSWSRCNANGEPVPAFGYIGKTKKSAGVANNSCKSYSAELMPDGTFEITVGGKKAFLGNLTVEVDNKLLDSRNAPPAVKDTYVDDLGNRHAILEGKLGDVSYTHHFTLTSGYIDVTTEFDYGDGCNFGPDIKDFEPEPRRTHYFQHEKKLCMNYSLEEKNAQLLYVSPFLTWHADPKARSLESLHYTALQGSGYGLAHMNIGQCAYGHEYEESSCRHVLSFSPHDYIYGRPQQLLLTGKHVHHYRFLPYAGDWRIAELTQRSHEFNRPIFATDTGIDDGTNTIEATSLLRIKANSTIATALFEREGKIYLRIAEWAGQADEVELTFGGEDTVYTECKHNLEAVSVIGKAFKMRPWEIKTILIQGKAEPVQGPETLQAKVFADTPSGWELKSQFECDGSCGASPITNTDGKYLYFVSGYHDGFVRPLEKHTPTMEIEMERTKKYPGYTNAWEVGGSCWVRMGINEPEYLEELKKYLKDGTVEITGGTWCEPFALIVSGESNIRQMYYGMKAIKENCDYDVKVFNNQEHGTYAQMPQILRSFGLYAVSNRTQWAPYGYESAIDAEVADWVGPDGTRIWVIPRYHSMDYNNCPWDDRNLQNGSVTGHNRVWRTEEKFEQMLREALEHGVEYPLMTMLEDIWDKALRTQDDELEMYASVPFVKFISFARYLEMLGITE